MSFQAPWLSVLLPPQGTSRIQTRDHAPPRQPHVLEGNVKGCEQVSKTPRPLDVACTGGEGQSCCLVPACPRFFWSPLWPQSSALTTKCQRGRPSWQVGRGGYNGTWPTSQPSLPLLARGGIGFWSWRCFRLFKPGSLTWVLDAHPHLEAEFRGLSSLRRPTEHGWPVPQWRH